jgi:hypothetical protein
MAQWTLACGAKPERSRVGGAAGAKLCLKANRLWKHGLIPLMQNGPGANLKIRASESQSEECSMLRCAVLVAVALLTAACRQEDETTGSVNDCMALNFPSYNPKAMDQCVAACKKCENGVTTTCTTSCFLKGARETKVQ